MLTYAHVCSRMLTYAHVCSEFLKTQARSIWSEVWEVLAQKYKYCLGGTSTKYKY